MYYFIFVVLFFLHPCKTDDVIEIVPRNQHVDKIGEDLIALLKTDVENNRVKELKQTLKNISQYVINNDVVAEAMYNVTNSTDLTHTNFYQSLSDSDGFMKYIRNDSKHLYLQVKERMTRDDVLTILSENSQQKELKKSARRMMSDVKPKKVIDHELNEVVDELLAEEPRDDHKVNHTESIYWDPQAELDKLKEDKELTQNGRRIFMGERTIIRHFPFMASIHIMGRFWCGGAIYSPDIVLTSASCLQLMHNNRFFRENPRAVQVRVGSNHSRIGGELVDVLEVYFHPSYNPRTLSDNLAVIRLRARLKMDMYKMPKIIRISTLETTVSPNVDIQVLGWGVTRLTQKMSFEPVFLQRKTLPVYPNKFCKEVYGDQFINEKMFCAGTMTTGEGACDHDAGGPAILAGKLVGIISFGPAVCGFPNAPTVFTLVGAYNRWIETINASMPAYYKGNVKSTTTERNTMNLYFSTWSLNSQTTPQTLFPPISLEGETSPTSAETGTTTITTTTPLPEPKHMLKALFDNYFEDT